MVSLYGHGPRLRGEPKPDLIGERFLGKYTLNTTSGTTRTPGIFVVDDPNMAVVSAMLLRSFRAWLGFGDVIKFLAGGSAWP